MSIQSLELTNTSLVLLPSLHFFFCKLGLVIPCLPHARKEERKTGTWKNSCKNTEVRPTWRGLLRAAVQVTGKSRRQLDVERHLDVKDICEYYLSGGIHGGPTLGSTIEARWCYESTVEEQAPARVQKQGLKHTPYPRWRWALPLLKHPVWPCVGWPSPSGECRASLWYMLHMVL